MASWRYLCIGLALGITLGSLAAADEPVYVARLRTPVVEDAISFPEAVAADLETGEVFVCDTRRSRIVIFDSEGLYLHEITGGVDFSSPRDLAVDAEGYLFVIAHRGGRSTLIQLDFDGLFLREIELQGLPGGSFPPRLTSVAVSPSGQRLALVDEENAALWITDRQGALLARADLADDLEAGARRDLQLGKVDIFGDRVLVAMTSLGKVYAFDLDGNFIRQVGEWGSGPCKLGRPRAAALDVDGELLIVDSQRMIVARWNLIDGRCLTEYLGIGDLPGFLYFPMDLALDGSGRFYVSQGFEGRVQAYDGANPPWGLD